MTVYNWITLLGVPALISSLWACLAALWKQNKAIKLGLQAVLRDRLLYEYRRYAEEGFADYDTKQCVLNLYVQYEALGKNGVMTDLHNKFMALPYSK